MVRRIIDSDVGEKELRLDPVWNTNSRLIRILPEGGLEERT